MMNSLNDILFFAAPVITVFGFLFLLYRRILSFVKDASNTINDRINNIEKSVGTRITVKVKSNCFAITNSGKIINMNGGDIVTLVNASKESHIANILIFHDEVEATMDLNNLEHED